MIATQKMALVLILACLIMFFCSGINAQSKTKVGEKVWEFSAAENMVPPVFLDGKIYAGNSKVIYRLDAQTGKKLSEFKVAVKQPIISLLPDNNRLYSWGWGMRENAKNVTIEICCFDIKTGKRIWGYEGPAGTRGAPAPIGPALYKEKLFIPGGCSAEPGGFTCLDAKTGNVLWQDKDLGVIQSAPVIYNDFIYVTTVCPLNTIRCYKIAKKDTFDLEVLWDFPKDPTTSHCENSVSAYKNIIYRFGTHLSRFDLTAQEREPKVTEFGMLWRLISVQAALAQDAEKLYVSSAKELYLLNKTDEQKDSCCFSPGGKLSFPAVAGGKIYAGCENNNLYCVDAKTGNKIWECACEDLNSEGNKKVSAPILAKGKVYLTGGKKIYCIESGDPKADGWHMEGGGPERGGYNRNEVK
ncbi:MAG: PQQ-binding-like beta-propeller repeat protein [Planctomycetota bacterium]